MPRRLIAVMISLVLLGCSLTQLFAPRGPSAFDMTATSINATNHWVATALAQTEIAAATLVSSPTVAPCYFNWATQDLPEITAEVQTAFDDAGLDNVTVSAYAYGENCYTYDTNEVQYFATMETDFRVTAQVDSLDDEEALGSLTAQILAVLNQFPPDATPGPQPGQISITFVQGDEQRTAFVNVRRANEIIGQGLTGAALWQALDVR